MILCLPVCEVGGQSAFRGRVELMPIAKGIGSLWLLPGLRWKWQHAPGCSLHAESHGSGS